MHGLSTAILAIITIWSLPFLTSSPAHSYSQQIDLPQEVHSVTTELDGPTSVEEWDLPFVQVETFIWQNTGSEYSLDYCQKKGHFRLETRYEQAGTQLVISSRRINTSIFVDGKLAETHKRFKVFVPRHLRYSAAVVK